MQDDPLYAARMQKCIDLVEERLIEELQLSQAWWRRPSVRIAVTDSFDFLRRQANCTMIK